MPVTEWGAFTLIPKYPRVMTEFVTMKNAVGGASLARIGDGELRLALGEGKHIAQEQDPKLTAELREVIWDDVPGLMVGIPNAEAPNGKPVMWGPTRYSAPRFVELYQKDRLYASSFICRPDSAPWIDAEEYWLMARKLWEDKHVVLVIGERGGSLTDLHHAASVEFVYGPERDAYRDIDKLEMNIITALHTPQYTGMTVLLCLGPAATCLAYRLARAGVHAVDCGHLGRFMPQRFLQKGK